MLVARNRGRHSPFAALLLVHRVVEVKILTARVAITLSVRSKLCCMKVEVDMEKISAEITAAEEAARKRMAEREKEAGDRGAREAPTCVLAEEEKHICATHGGKPQQTPLSESSGKQCDSTESSGADAPGEPGAGLRVSPFDPNAF